MENEKIEEKETKVDVKEGKIDKDVLDVMKDEDVLKALGDDKQIKRVILNCFCEFLSEIRQLRKEFDEFSQMISVCSADKLADFFKELQSNVSQETKRLNVKEKISKSHLKSKKSSKNLKKVRKSVK